MNPTPHPIALAIGANIGDRLAALRAARAALAEHLAITAVSPIYETPAAYVTDQPSFLNAAICATTKLAPQVLLETVKQIEHDIGRRPTFRYGPRAIDIDILFYGDSLLQTGTLIIPHPLMQEREFVLRPLADIAADWQHPITKQTVAVMLATLPAAATAQRIAELL